MNFDDILRIEDGNEFINQLVFYIQNKTDNNVELLPGERFIDLYIRFLTTKDMEGFCDIFYQDFSLDECNDFIYWLNNLGLKESAEKFKRALDIYCRGKECKTNVEFKSFDPFTIENSVGKEFDEIGEFFNNERCGLYNCEEEIKKWIKFNRSLF